MSRGAGSQINPRTGEQYHCRDTFDAAGLGYKYDSLFQLPGIEGDPELMREEPLVCIFQGVEKARVNGAGQCGEVRHAGRHAVVPAHTSHALVPEAALAARHALGGCA